MYRGTMNEQFKKFLKEPVAGSGQVLRAILYRMTMYHRPARPTFTGDVLIENATSMPAIHEPITQAVGQAQVSRRILRK